MPAVCEIFYRRGRVVCAERIDYNELYFHALWQYALYIYARVVAIFHSVAVFRKSREVRRQLNEYAVFLDRADDSGNRFAGFERGGVLFPCAEQFAVRERNAPQFVAAFDYCADVLPRRKPRVRVQNAPNGSMCVTQASITSPQTSDERYSLRQSSCTLRRLRMAYVSPF